MSRKSMDLFWVVVGALVCYFSYGMDLGTPSLPGPGFFPFWSGIIMAGSAGAILIKDTAGKDDHAGETAGRSDLKNVLVVSSLLIGFSVLLNIAGFILCTFVFVALLLRFVGSQKWAVVVLGALLASTGTYALLQGLLEAQLPKGILGF